MCSLCFFSLATLCVWFIRLFWKQKTNWFFFLAALGCDFLNRMNASVIWYALFQSSNANSSYPNENNAKLNLDTRKYELFIWNWGIVGGSDYAHIVHNVLCVCVPFGPSCIYCLNTSIISLPSTTICRLHL